MNNNNNATGVAIVSIHDRTQQGVLAFDICDILECLLTSIESYQWVVFDLDFTGESYGAEGKVLTTSALLDSSRKAVQTIDGKFVAYESQPDPVRAREDFTHFPDSHAFMAVVAVDSTYYEVYTKNSDHIRLLKRRFVDVREEDPNQFFLSNEGG